MESKIKKRNNTRLSETQPEAETRVTVETKPNALLITTNALLTETVIYKAKVQYEHTDMEYIWLTDNPFKTKIQWAHSHF